MNGRRMHFRIGWKRILRLRWIKVLEEELRQEVRLMHLVGASAEPKEFARQKPGQTILISAAVGLVLGLILKSGRK